MKRLPKKEKVNEWYPEVLLKGEIMDYSKVSGCIILRPYGYAIWENIMHYLDGEIKKIGGKNAYFPLFIPESLFKREEEHVEGFSPEVAWVTHGGDTLLGERLAIRPTSETIMYDSYKKWIRSWRDLPLKINQWVNVVRWEFKHPTPFLRGREFLWQEGHTAFSNKKDAEKEVRQVLDIYQKIYRELLNIPVIRGKKTEEEKFAGADYTLSIEAWLPLKKFAQAATSHFLGQNFSKAFDIYFYDQKEEKKYIWQNSWGFSTRSIGIALMSHGDDKGLIIPPMVAPIKIIIIPIYNTKNKEKILDYAERIKEKIKCLKVYSLNKEYVSKIKEDEIFIDNDDETPGAKFYKWELKGVPIRIEIGEKEVNEKKITVVSRIGEKKIIDVNNIESIEEMFVDLQKRIYEERIKELREEIVIAESKEEVENIINNGKAALIKWCGCRIDIEKAKAIHLPYIEDLENYGIKKGGKCICGKKGKEFLIIGRSI